MELPVVNHKDYVAKIDDDHKFPIKKFGELANYLIERKIVSKFYEPNPCSIETLKIRGMMVAFGNASGYVDTIDVKKDINAKGLFFTRPSIAHYTIKREELVESAKKVFDAILSNKFKVEISKKYSLKDAAQAHKDLEARLLTGPAVIIP